MFNLLNFFYVGKYYDHEGTYLEHHHTKEKQAKHDFEKCLYENNYSLIKCKDHIFSNEDKERTNKNYQKCMKEANNKELNEKYCEERYQSLDKDNKFNFDKVTYCSSGIVSKFNNICIPNNLSPVKKCLIEKLNERGMDIDSSNMSDEEKKKLKDEFIEAKECSTQNPITKDTCKDNSYFHRALYICDKDKSNMTESLKGLFDFNKGFFPLIYILFVILTFIIIIQILVTTIGGFIYFIMKDFIPRPNRGRIFPRSIIEYFPIPHIFWLIKILKYIVWRIWPMLFILVLVFYILWKFVGWLGFVWNTLGIFTPESEIIFEWFDGLFFGCFKSGTAEQTLLCDVRHTWSLIEGIIAEQMKKTTDLSEKEIKDKINSWRDINVSNEFFTNYNSDGLNKPQTKIIEHFDILDRLDKEVIFKNIDKINEMTVSLTNKVDAMKSKVNDDLDNAKKENQERMESSDSE